MNILTEHLPYTVNIGGSDYPINTDFRVMIKVSEILESDIDPNLKIEKCFNLAFGSIPDDVDGAVDALINFYLCENALPESSDGRAAQPAIEPCYSFKYDASYILSAFIQQYNIDLSAADMHWFKFKALFDSLTEGSLFFEIKKCRAMEITSDMSEGQKEYYRKMKKAYALPINKSDKEITDRLTQALMNGGDVSAILSEIKNTEQQ